VTVLREREHELAEVTAALGEAGAGRGCAVVIEGDAGLGKTRLLQEARRAGSSAGLEVLSARATDLERDFPFSLVQQLFGGWLAAIPAHEREALLEGAGAARGALGLDPSQDPTYDSFAVLHALYWVTAALTDTRPLLLVVDDAHTADAASLDYLRFLLPRLDELPVLLVLAARPHEPNPPEGLSPILTDTSVRHLPLSPLSAAAAAALLTQELGNEADPGFAAACYEVSGGNPFLVCELVRTLEQDQIEATARQAEAVRKLAPERVMRMVLARIGQFPPEAAALARSLAVLGEDSELHLVAELAGADLGESRRVVDQLRAAAIFDAGAGLRFSHPLVRNAIYADMPVGEREAAHTEAAGLLRVRNASPEQIATQLLASQAREERATVETLIEAGERALATGAARSAIAYLTRALAEPPPPDLRAETLGPLLTASIRATDDSVTAEIEADLLAEMERDPSLRGEWIPKLTLWMSFRRGRFDEAIAMLKEAAELAVAEGDVELACRLDVQLRPLRIFASSTSVERPEADLPSYADRLDPNGPGARLAAAMEIVSALRSGTASQVLDAAERALANDCSIFAEEQESFVSMMAVVALAAADEMNAARYGAERAFAIARGRDVSSDFIRAWYLRAVVAWNFGELAAAEADMRQGLNLAKLAGVVPVVLLAAAPFLVDISIERDELEAAEAELRIYGMPSGPIPENSPFGLLRLKRGQLRAERGEFDRAAEDLATLANQVGATGLGPVPIAAASPFAARALVATGELSQARELVAGVEVLARRWGAPTTVSQALRAAAVVQGGEEGVELLEEAMALMAGSPKRLLRAHALADLGAALRGLGRAPDAREPLREAFQLARQCGAVRLAKRTQAELQESGVSMRRYTPIGAESLTPSERRVAELAAAGMSNRQIAQALFVTLKTVEAHLSAAYDKLDISSRKQLPRELGIS
jgi:DNA-binding CsgD family transcriptional regulator